MSETCIDASRRLWVASEVATVNELRLGCLQRIAAATELSCKDREKLERDYNYMRNQRDRYRQESERMARRIASLRGVITKMKRADALAKGDGE